MASDGEQDEGQPQTCEQFMLGPHLLVQPVTAIELTSTRVYLPADQPDQPATWYDLHTGTKFTSMPGARVATVDVHADHVPAFVRGGAVLPKRMRLRRSSQGTHTDPFTLIVAPDGRGAAAGQLFVDGYDGYDGQSLTAQFSFEQGRQLRGVVGELGSPGHLPPAASSVIERIIIFGQTAPRKVEVRTSTHNVLIEGVEATFDAAAGTITVRQPKVALGTAWTIDLL